MGQFLGQFYIPPYSSPFIPVLGEVRPGSGLFMPVHAMGTIGTERGRIYAIDSGYNIILNSVDTIPIPSILLKNNLISDTEVDELRDEINHISKMLSGLIKGIERKKT